MKLLTTHDQIQGRTIRPERGIRRVGWLVAIHFTDGTVLMLDRSIGEFSDDGALLNVCDLRELTTNELCALGINLAGIEANDG